VVDEYDSQSNYLGSYLGVFVKIGSFVNAGPESVNYSVDFETQDFTAIAGQDYVPMKATTTWNLDCWATGCGNGYTTKEYRVAILSPRHLWSTVNKRIKVSLSNPQGGPRQQYGFQFFPKAPLECPHGGVPDLPNF
jgi:hypothetical protein